MLFTINPEIKNEIDKLDGLTIIGELVKDEAGVIIKNNGEKLKIENGGWDHLKLAKHSLALQFLQLQFECHPLSQLGHF